MLTVWGPRHRYCDGVDRRSFLRVGALGLGGITLANLMEAEAKGSSDSKHRSVIMVYLSGGLSHLDTFDLKPKAAPEVRGEFKPIATSLPGVEFGELLPRLAATAHRIALVRSIVGLQDEHSSFQTLTGWPMGISQTTGKPHFGSVVSRLLGPARPSVPPFVDLFPRMQHRPYNSPGPGYLGRAHAAVTAGGDELAVMKLGEINGARLGDRRSLLDHFDRWRRSADAAGASMDLQYQRAYDVLTSSRLVEALDVDREPAPLRDRYGRGSSQHLGDGAPLWNDQLLMARRLVEAGVRCVTVAYGFWDTHGNNFGHLKSHLPTFDQGVAALIEDIYERGLDKDVTVLVWGEFGRTPKINKDAGRDHWSRVNFSLFSGGGLRVGQVIGSTDTVGAFARERPVPFHDVLATAYHRLGIDSETMISDRSGRPTALLSAEAQPIRELF